jgi:hypothetical protein
MRKNERIKDCSMVWPEVPDEMEWKKGMRIRDEEVSGVGCNDEQGWFIMYKDAPTIYRVPRRTIRMLMMRLKSKWYDEILRKMLEDEIPANWAR